MYTTQPNSRTATTQLRALLVLILILTSLGAAQTAGAQTNVPGLYIPTDIVAAVGQSVAVPVTFDSQGTAIAATAFSVDFDEACLAFDHTDADDDGIPDAVTVHAPAPFSASVVYDANDRDGELDFLIADTFPPLATLPAGELATIQFRVTCQPAPGGAIAIPIRFSADPAASFGDTAGRSVAGSTVDGQVTVTAPLPGTPVERAIGHLADVMDQFNNTFDVYSDLGAAGNHFPHRARIGTDVTLNEAVTTTVHSGSTAIRNTFIAKSTNWGGWYFQNGVLLDDDIQPRENWGTYPNAGFDLTGATRLSFYARGEQGGERVEFFAFGVGRNPYSGAAIELYPDSEAKVTACGRLAPCFVTLTTSWQRHTIDLTGLDLSYVIGGFGWVTNAPQNQNRSVTFYLDDIAYELARPDDLRFLVSFQTLPTHQDFDTVMRNVAFTYDNALALMAFTAAGDWRRARLLADAFVYAQQHDRFYADGRLRSAYMAGDLILPPGWTPHGRVGTVRLPGWWDPTHTHWYEDSKQVGTDTGNMAWALLALLNFYEAQGGAAYLDAALALGNWIESNVRDTRGAGGYTGGYVGWEPTPTQLTWKSTEHNLDIYAAFARLYQITGDPAWQVRAQHARDFVTTMWNDADGHFWTGTEADGVTLNTQAIPLDAQSWALLALGLNARTAQALAFAESHHAATFGSFSGFDFDTDRDMPWPEGTGQMAVAYAVLGDDSQAAHYRQQLWGLQTTATNANGKGIVAAPADGLTTGFDWLYFNRLHVGATAWAIFAEWATNVYWPSGIIPGTCIPLPAPAAYGRIAHGDDTHVDQIEFCFPGRAGDLLLRYDAWDIDGSSEVDIRLNGHFVGRVPFEAAGIASSLTARQIAAPNANNAWTGPHTLRLPDDLVLDHRANVLVFDNIHNPPNTYWWGIRNVDIAGSMYIYIPAAPQ